MKYLLDTHVLLWSLLDTRKLSKRVSETLENRKNEIYVSTVTFWEVALKSSIGKLEFENLNIDKIPSYVEKTGYKTIELGQMEAIEFGRLPLKERHKDPFDRILIWQAISRKMILLSKDERMKEYETEGLRYIW